VDEHGAAGGARGGEEVERGGEVGQQVGLLLVREVEVQARGARGAGVGAGREFAAVAGALLWRRVEWWVRLASRGVN
jgi:hypothetical protein